MRHALSIALLISLFAANLHAATFIVTNVNDSGAGSLRAAITSVNASVDATNTINFNIPGTGPFTIAPATDLPTIVKNVTINGYSQPGSSVNTLAQGDNAVLQIVLNGSNYTVGDGLTTGNGLYFAAGSDGSVVKGLVINEWVDNGILVDTTNTNITGITIVGNFIGTNATGTAQMANRTGIALAAPGNFDPINTVIGTPAPADRNLIAGSLTTRGVDSYGVRGACIFSFFGINTTIQNNYIGTDKTGTKALGNSLLGLVLWAESGSTLGGSSANMGNIISGHLVYGLDLRACGACTIQNNYFGTDVSGTVALGNGNAGIYIRDNFQATVGGNVGSTISNNLISGNGLQGNALLANGNGIQCGDNVLPGAILNTITNNKIGTDITGLRALPNTGYGVIVDDSQNTVSNNIISGNLAGGVLIYSILGQSTVVTGNKIGTDFSGFLPIPNGGNGIQIGLDSNLSAPSNNIIGQ
jgi:hypothetical protein